MRQDQDVGIAVRFAGGERGVECCRDDEGAAGDGHQRGHGACDGFVEALFAAVEAAGNETTAEDLVGLVSGEGSRKKWCETYKKNIRENASQHARLHNANLPLRQSHNTNNQLNRIPKRRIQQPPNRLPQLGAELLRRKAQQCRKRHDGEEIEHKHGARIPPQRPADNPQRHKHQQHVDVVGDERQPGDVKRALGVLAPGLGVVVAPELARRELGLGFLGDGGLEERGALAVGRARHAAV